MKTVSTSTPVIAPIASRDLVKLSRKDALKWCADHNVPLTDPSYLHMTRGDTFSVDLYFGRDEGKAIAQRLSAIATSVYVVKAKFEWHENKLTVDMYQRDHEAEKDALAKAYASIVFLEAEKTKADSKMLKGYDAWINVVDWYQMRQFCDKNGMRVVYMHPERGECTVVAATMDFRGRLEGQIKLFLSSTHSYIPDVTFEGKFLTAIVSVYEKLGVMLTLDLAHYEPMVSVNIDYSEDLRIEVFPQLDSWSGITVYYNTKWQKDDTTLKVPSISWYSTSGSIDDGEIFLATYTKAMQIGRALKELPMSKDPRPYDIWS